jgi:predicted transposase YdaD
MPAEHDSRYKYLFSHPGFVERLLTSFVDEPFVEEIDFAHLERVNTSFVSEEFQQRESDIIWKLPLKGSTIYLFLLLEFQSTLDRRMPLRFLRYITAFYEAYLDEHPGLPTLPAVFPLLLYNGDDTWSVPYRIDEMIEPTIPERFIPRLGYYPIIINAIPKERLERIKNAVSAVFYVENSDPENLAQEWEKVEAILKEEEDHAYEVFLRLGRWLKNYLETGGRGDPETLDRVKSTREVKAMFGTKLKQYGERIAEEAREEGREKGREEGLELVALRMLDQGRSVDEIAEITGLSKERVEGLRK